jgi:hypothetical protein
MCIFRGGYSITLQVMYCSNNKMYMEYIAAQKDNSIHYGESSSRKGPHELINNWTTETFV